MAVAPNHVERDRIQLLEANALLAHVEPSSSPLKILPEFLILCEI